MSKTLETVGKFIEENFKDAEWSVLKVVVMESRVDEVVALLQNCGIILIAFSSPKAEEYIKSLTEAGENPDEYQQVNVVVGTENAERVAEIIESMNADEEPAPANGNETVH